MSEPDSPELTVYYDGACPLCRAEISHYRRCEGAERVAFVDVAMQEPGNGLSRAEALARFHVRAPDGALVSGAAAFGRLWRSLPGWRWLGRLIETPLLLPWAEVAYRASLPLRPRLARLLRRRLRKESAARSPP
jgi:predicted DCC family thiol-disulfide oxidoreductase YuxK